MDMTRLIRVMKRLSPYKLSVYNLLRESAIKDSAQYAEQHLATAMIFQEKTKLWNFAASAVKLEQGMLVEFGVFKGQSINHFAAIFPDETLHGFDSFEGLAEDWTGYHLVKGTFDLGGNLPEVAKNVVLHKGWFDRTLPDFLKKTHGQVRLCHIDCDTYESALFVLDKIAKRLKAGSIVVFDEYYGYPNWRAGEHRAWQEVVEKYGISYKYIAFAEMQVAVEIT